MDFFKSTSKSKTFQAGIEEAICKAEKTTSCEIKLHIQDSACKGSPLEVAARVFAKLGMHKTSQRNGVLIYISSKSHKLAIIGDVGVNRFVKPDFWNSILKELIVDLKEGHYEKGLVKAIEQISLVLSEFFPWQVDDLNELNNEISYG
jgi:uncharacterized membrane protein